VATYPLLKRSDCILRNPVPVDEADSEEEVVVQIGLQSMIGMQDSETPGRFCAGHPASWDARPSPALGLSAAAIR